jgi:hypothetical protein
MKTVRKSNAKGRILAVLLKIINTSIMWNLGTGITIPERTKDEYLAKHEQNFAYFGITTSTTLAGQCILFV